ncbi:MAG: serine/threonine-protein kinase, partial [Candidatus Promineifilaceae bacterium]|nr:serine/threonine-protein kinase [Candidatus Promineifilaceae bacterium]
MSNPETIGRYEIIDELGRGGMAVVYLARDPLMARRVAVKLLPRQFTFNESLRARFQREARIVASLEHPAIVPVHDFGEFNEQPFLVMRYMVGGSLSQYAQGKPLPLPDVVRILTPLAQALDKAHTKHIIHRDLKPDNILFDGDKNPYLSDFGIARLAEGTQTTSIMGTPAYMSPEQITGDVELDGRSDIYALGVILFEMLSGKQPFAGETPTNIMMKHVLEPVPSILKLAASLPPATQGIIETAMAKNREERFATAEEMVTAVFGLLSDTQAAEAGLAIAGSRVQETQLELSDPAAIRQKTVVEPEIDTELEALYGKLQSANEQGDWVEVLALGAKIQRLAPDYRDTATILEEAKTRLTQPAKSPDAEWLATAEAVTGQAER